MKKEGFATQRGVPSRVTVGSQLMEELTMTAYPFKQGPGLPLPGQRASSTQGVVASVRNEQLGGTIYVSSARDGHVMGGATTRSELSVLEQKRADYDRDFS